MVTKVVGSIEDLIIANLEEDIEEILSKYLGNPKNIAQIIHIEK